MISKLTFSRAVFNVINYTFMGALILTIIFPFVNAAALSFSGKDAIQRGMVGFIPVDFNFLSYQVILTNSLFIQSLLNTVMLTIVNTTCVILISLCAAYALAHKDFKGVRVAFAYIIIPMYFSGGMIPTYLLINGLKLTDNLLALILPVIVSPLLIIILRNNIYNLPQELRESAEIDGAGNFTTLFRIIAPVILPTITAFIIIQAVAYWNEWFSCMIYIRSPGNFTLQYKLREIISTNELASDPKNFNMELANMRLAIHPQNMKMAALLVTILPIVVIYPFLQKYFIHGVIVGAVKG